MYSKINIALSRFLFLQTLWFKNSCILKVKLDEAYGKIENLYILNNIWMFIIAEHLGRNVIIQI